MISSVVYWLEYEGDLLREEEKEEKLKKFILIIDIRVYKVRLTVNVDKDVLK